MYSAALTRLEHDARQPRLAMEADGPSTTKTCERMEGAATAVQAMHGDSCSADGADPDPVCCHKFVPVLVGDRTKIAPPGDLFDQPPGEMS